MFIKKNATNAAAATKSCPIKLSVIPEANFKTTIIKDKLENHVPIYAWYTLGKPSVSAFESFTGKNMEGLMMFRKEIDFLCTYVAHFVDGVITLRLYEVSMMSTENVEQLITERLETATTVMYDDSGLTEFQQTFDHDVTDEMAYEALKSRKTWVIGDEHFHKKA